MTLATIALLAACVIGALAGTNLALRLTRRFPQRPSLASLPRTVAALLPIVVVTGVALACLVAFGRVTNLTLHRLEGPAYAWLVDEAAVTGTAYGVIELLTQAGDPAPMALVGAVALVAFAVGWPDRDRIIVPILVGGTFASSWVLQRVTEYLVGRESPPLGPGTFPSGGSARIMCVTVLIVVLASLRWRWPASRRRIGWYVAAVLAALEGFTRLVLLIHWPTDVPAGWAAGAATSFSVIVAAAVWSRRRNVPVSGPER